jgi:2-dehydro-3-deoxyphosphogalactonate aldolase
MTGASLTARLDAAFATLPLVAILRGLSPAEAEATARALYDRGFRLIEVPLNSPQPFDSIAAIRNLLPSDALVGAGTVMTVEQVSRLADIGAELVVMPHADTEIIRATKAQGMVSLPGVTTPTEAFAALNPKIVKAMRAVLPPDVRLLPVGGISPDTMQVYHDAGVAGFGLGSALYTPGMTVAQVAERAERFVAAWGKLSGQ